jgi:iron complex outermembrane receptor protein
MKKTTSRLLCSLLLASGVPTTLLAQTSLPDLGQATLEELMNIEITSVSHKRQRLAETAAAVFVITRDDIRRSGMTTVPELLRLAPGVQVAQINSSKWAVAVRGFNQLFGDKLLVLIDGRTVYDRLNSGVFWESLDMPLDDIDRIEVIRGPGGATWGANAANGVINIVTKSAADTPGAAVTVGGGTLDGTRVAARYGGRLGTVAYRLSSQWAGHDQSQLANGSPAHDSWQSQNHGFRLDWDRASDAMVVQGGVTLGSLHGLFHEPSGPVPAIKPLWSDRETTEEYNVLGRWTRRRDNGSTLQVQSFFNAHHNNDSVNPRQMLADVDAQYQFALGARHDVVVGAGYRFLNEHVDGGIAFSIMPNIVHETIVNTFAQDEIALGRRVQLTLGGKLERDSYVGWGVQPTARLMWSPAAQHHVWAAASRALRSPSLSDISGRYNYTSFVGQGGLPVVVGALGNPGYRSETVLDAEAGYRAEIGSVASVDVTLFRASYHNLKTSEPLAPRIELTPAPMHLFIPVQFGNLLAATTAGVEIAAHWTPVSAVRLDGGYSTFRLTPHLSTASRDTASASFDGTAPGATWYARSATTIAPRVRLDGTVFHSGALAKLAIPAYTRLDLQLEMSFTRHMSVAIVGQNLLDPAHAEFGSAGGIVNATFIPRSARVQVGYRF